MTVTQPEQASKVRVPSADDMDLETFCLHMGARHTDSLGGLSELDPELMERTGLEELYRTFHDKLHSDPLLFNREFDHRHRRPGNE